MTLTVHRVFGNAWGTLFVYNERCSAPENCWERRSLIGMRAQFGRLLAGEQTWLGIGFVASACVDLFLCICARVDILKQRKV